jgi:cytochrome oxidase Cu insertion factor (SCO1/SenC/PrrC family)
MRRLVVVAAAAALVGAIALALALARPGSEPEAFRGSTPPPGIAAPDFVFHDYTGDSVRMRDLRGKVVLITFLDSQCTESCPIIATRIARTLPLLDEDERRQVEAVAISTDPTEDTPESVRAFLRRNRALGVLHYLVGPEKDMRAAWSAFEILPSEDTGIDTLHSAPVRIYDRRGVWVATLHAGADLTEENLLHDIRVALSAR